MDKLKLKSKLFESRLRINFHDLKEIKQKLTICEKLGIQNVILEPKIDQDVINTKKKREIQDLTEINLFFRRTYNIKNLHTLKQKIRKFNKVEEIISIESSDKDVQNYAARDSRIDLISFSNYGLLKSFSDGVVSLAKQYNTYIELCLKSVMIEKRSYQSKIFRSLFKLIHMGIDGKLILSGDFKNLYDLRHPRSLISIVHTLFEMPLSKAKLAFSSNVLSLLEKVQLRTNPALYEDGVKLIKKEKN